MDAISSLITFLPYKDSKVVSVINSSELFVITTLTLQPSFLSRLDISAALYAAMLPVIPSKIFLFVSMSIILHCTCFKNSIKDCICFLL